MKKRPRERCDNCSARPRGVRTVRVGGKPTNLCVDCLKVLIGLVQKQALQQTQ